MKAPLYYRKAIPFFYDKSEKEIQQDSYERFDPMVVRQSALHLADELWNGYFMDAVLQFAKPYCSDLEQANIVELGCGVGRWIASFAKQFPSAHCWGIDYSYQMLKRAQEVWIQNKSVSINLSRYGFLSTIELKTHELENLQFALAKASKLPFDKESQDIVLTSFLLDRLENPIEGLEEMRRILRPKGRLILITPLNFRTKKNWEQFYPAAKIHQLVLDLGFELLDWRENFRIEEPLDIHGNVVRWKCMAMVGQKK